MVGKSLQRYENYLKFLKVYTCLIVLYQDGYTHHFKHMRPAISITIPTRTATAMIIAIDIPWELVTTPHTVPLLVPPATERHKIKFPVELYNMLKEKCYSPWKETTTIKSQNCVGNCGLHHTMEN